MFGPWPVGTALRPTGWIVPAGGMRVPTYNRGLPNTDGTALNSGLQNKDKTAKAVAPAKAVPPAPDRVAPSRREIRTVLVAAHGWPTEALPTSRRTSRR